MTISFGFCVLAMALGAALLQGGLSLWGAHRQNTHIISRGIQAAYIQFGLIAIAFMSLIAAFVRSNFSFKLVAAHSHSQKPLLYKISAVWGNHEGSILLWTLILALYGILMAIYSRHLSSALRARAIGIQGLIGAGFLSFILFTSNPFLRLSPAAPNGKGLNPILQDPGLAFHPPLLYLGYVGGSVAFSFTIAALLEGKIDKTWTRTVRPWVILPWSFLTLGICLGSFWAYYELGWGGWWAWDPVENTSFMPWLSATALLHTLNIVERRPMMKSWVCLLAISTFALSLTGTFVVRSGVLVSVHAFAVDPMRGVFILALLVSFIGSALILYSQRSHLLHTPKKTINSPRIRLLILNNLFLISACILVALGTFLPLFIDALFSEKISVGAPYFNSVMPIIFLPLLLFMAIMPWWPWKKDKLQHNNWSVLVKWFIASLLICSFLVFLSQSLTGGIGLYLAILVGLACLYEFLRKRHLKTFHWPQNVRGLGFLIAHMGVALFAFGVIAVSIWGEENYSRLKVGESMPLRPHYQVHLQAINLESKANYQALQATLVIKKHAKPPIRLQSERRYYPVRAMITTEAGFIPSLGITLFAALGEGDPQDGFIVRAYYHPFVAWIWIGTLFMAFGGLVSLIPSGTYVKEQ